MAANASFMLGVRGELQIGQPRPIAVAISVDGKGGWGAELDLEPGLGIKQLADQVLGTEAKQPGAELPDLDLIVKRLGYRKSGDEEEGDNFTFIFKGRLGIDLAIEVKKEGGKLSATGKAYLTPSLALTLLYSKRQVQPGPAEPRSKAFAAILGNESPELLSLKDLLKPIILESAQDVSWLPDLEFAPRKAYFIYYKPRNNEKERYLFGLDVALKGGFDLAELPLIGMELPPGKGKIEIDGLRFSYSNHAFTAAEVKDINALLPPPQQLPARAIEKGLDFDTGVKLGGSLLTLPTVRLGGGDKPPPKSAQAEKKGPPDTATRLGPLFVRSVDLEFDAKKMSVGLTLTGGIRISSFELELIDARVSVAFKKNEPPTPPPLTPTPNPTPTPRTEFQVEGSLGGLGLSLKVGPVAVSGAFMKMGPQKYGGLLRVEVPKFSIGAMGIYEVYQGKTSLFIYGSLSLPPGAGIPIGPLKITGLALALGLNRRMLVPPIEKVAKFPLVAMAMGEVVPAGPAEALKELDRSLPAELGQYFGALGLRFTIAETFDCFALGIVQFGNELEISLLGLARLDKQNLCFAELAIKILFKPSAGLFLAQAQLTANSWVFDKKCKLTGGFALALWFSGPHKGDFVITIGGYHSRFKKPEHYPEVPRLGINWAVTDELSVKGELYCAVTTSAFMAGGRLELAYRSGSITAEFIAYLDLLMEWAPLNYMLDVGISLRIKAKIAWKTIDFSIGIELHVWGPPFAGRAVVDLSIISFSIDFGNGRKKAEPIESWAKFGAQFIEKSTPEKPGADLRSWAPLVAGAVKALGPQIFTPSLTRGQITRRSGKQDPDRLWLVRGDELELAASTLIPAGKIAVGKLADPKGLPGDTDGKNWKVAKPMPVQEQPRGAHPAPEPALGVRPMARAQMDSRLVVAICKDDARDTAAAVDLTRWTVSAERMGQPPALWSNQKPDTDHPPESPTATLIADCITGIARLKPPRGEMTPSGACVVNRGELRPIVLPERTAARCAPAGEPPGSQDAAAALKAARFRAPSGEKVSNGQ